MTGWDERGEERPVFELRVAVEVGRPQRHVRRATGIHQQRVLGGEHVAFRRASPRNSALDLVLGGCNRASAVGVERSEDRSMAGTTERTAIPVQVGDCGDDEEIAASSRPERRRSGHPVLRTADPGRNMSVSPVAAVRSDQRTEEMHAGTRSGRLSMYCPTPVRARSRSAAASAARA